ncbi:membrane or secreted protein [Neorhodopirellula pilleata]|uniref:Uncharacterized protein n=1 Tax=Neorhodopirellula pilleata TaxID=2714738 RepID=A0A5C5ZPV5_9BACT|nr:membrane or secreted protein [Neorhodopirellula pilleata]TWT89514.1 hypothetical protein Pla100_54430 [Neorhodopirellula pilleata]
MIDYLRLSIQVLFLACLSATATNAATAIHYLPADAAGVVRVPDVPTLRQAWQKTTLYSVRENEAMQPLLDASFGPQGVLWSQVGDRVGIRGKDLIEIGTGELVVAWLPFENDRRQPSAVCLIAETKGKEAAAAAVLDRIDRDLKENGSTRRDVIQDGQEIRIYQPKTRPGQLKIEQVVIASDGDRIVAADRDSVVIEILKAITNDGRTAALADDELYQTVRTKVEQRTAIEQPGSEVEWFVRPLAMGRIIRDVAKVDRGNKVKILNLLENQGFDAIQAMGGTVVVSQGEFDLLHRGYIHAPPVTAEPDRYRLAARMLQFPNGDLYQMPGWIPKTVASVTQVNWKIEDAFWAVETLVDEAFNDRIFRPTIGGILEDEEGPQIDLENSVLPNLGNHLLLLTDNTEPITVDSERLLVAIEVRDEDAIRNAVRKAMEVEPDVSRVESVEGVDIWKVQRGGESEDVNEEFFNDFGITEPDTEDQQPLLDTWAIAMVGKAKGSTKPYLIFASHVDFLVEVAERIQSGAGDGLSELPEIQSLIETTKKMGADQIAIHRVVRLRESLRTKYELQRRGELKESDSVLATIIRRIANAKDEPEIERPNAAKWPAYDQVQEFFRNASSFVETTPEGWNLNAFLLHE